MPSCERSYHPDGSLRSEASFVGGVPHGITRHWHPNGVLALEIPLCEGLAHGKVMQWNEQGVLLGSFEMVHGTGVYRGWYPTGQLQSEVNMVEGKWTGRMRVYWDDGSVVSDQYWLENRKVTKQRYHEAALANPQLPRYDDDAPRPAAESRSRAMPQLSSQHPGDDLSKKLLAKPNTREARAWLTEADRPERTLGEATSVEDSVKLVESLYRLGAVTVHAVEIYGADNQEQNSGKLVIELPENVQARKALLDFAGEIAEELGFDPEPDEGQRYLFLMLD